MKFRNIAAALVAAVLILALLSGCAGQQVSPLVSSSPEVSDSASPDTSADVPADPLKLADAYAALSPDTVMLTADGNDITWEELFCLMFIFINQLQTQMGPATDWSTEIEPGVTVGDYVLDHAVNYALQEEAVQYGAGELGLAFSDEDEAAIQSTWDAQVESAGNEEAFVEMLESSYCTKDIYMKLISSGQLATVCFNDLYGSDGSKVSDEQVAEYTADDGYLMAKHILMLTTKANEDGTEVEMTETEKQQVYDKMTDILDQLNSYEGDDFDAFFDELMTANSEDPGVVSFPDGYLFLPGNMVPEFEEATLALDIGKFSDIIETDYGYHIIYRLPVDFDAAPTSGNGMDSLRYITASNMYNAVQDAWMENLDVTYSDAYNALDLAAISAED